MGNSIKILVIGESCVDEYVYGHCDRICPEAPAICFKSNGKMQSGLGMAGNVMSNIKSIRPEFHVDIITNLDSTIVKRRFIDKRYNSIVFRQDINDSCNRIDIDKYQYSNYDAVIFSDYCKGFLEETDISSILKRIEKPSVSFIDTKKKIGDFISGVNFLKINNKEFTENVIDINKIKNTCQVIVTKGELGALHIDKYKETIYETPKIEVRDVCGAGDTFLAGLVIKYIETKDVSQSIKFANECSSKVVSKFGVSTP
jgi:D-beta-D-heptose 7-phosphate kinase/D-beta-D-heptose 1-phosphate adenosyltransferase